MNLKRRILIAVGAFVLFINLFFFRPIGSMAFVTFFLGLLVYLTQILPIVEYRRKYPVSYYSVLTILLFLIGVVPFRGNYIVQFGLLCSILLSFMYLVYLPISDIPFVRSVWEAFTVPFRLLQSYFLTCMRLVTGSISYRDKEQSTIKYKQLLSIIGGTILAIPVVAILIGLLTSADPIFARSVSNLTNSFHFSHLIQRIIGSLITIAIILPLAKLIRPKYIQSPLKFVSHLMITTPTSIITALVALTMGFFLIVDWPYIFVSVARETDLSQFGVATYSEYVRRGFGELLIVGIILYGLIWVGYVVLRIKNPQKVKLLEILQYVLIGEFMIFLLSITRRILLYWQFHGLTLVRIYGGIMLLFIFALTVILLVRHFWTRHWVNLEIAIIVGFIIFCGVWNADLYLIAHHPPTVNNRVDYVYLSRLSPDGYDGWVTSYNFAQKTIKDLSDRDPITFSEDNRRDFLYSGAIVGSLTRVYHHFAQTYATPNQKNHYSQTIHNSILGALQTYISITNADLQLRSQKGYDKPGSMDNIINGNLRDRETRSITLTQQIDSAKKYSEKIEDNSRHDSIAVQTTEPFHSLGFGRGRYRTFQKSESNTSVLFCMPSFYHIELNPVRKQSILDTYFVWNFRNAATWDSLNKDIPIDELVQIQEKYIDIFYKIMRLPENNRSFRQDISTESLFLQTY